VPGKTIPERALVGDPFTGYVIEYNDQQALALTEQPGAETVASGEFVIRYGLRYLGKLHLSVVPGLVALDYGDFLTGEDAWQFLLKNSNQYPRSDVVGYRSDGRDEMVVIKALDISAPPEVLAYHDPAATTPIAKPTAVIAPDDAALPPRLLDFLPRFASLSEWQSSE